MDVYSFQADPAPNRFFDKDGDGTVPAQLVANTGNNLGKKLEVAYLERVSQYKKDIGKQVYPVVTVDLPGGTETIVFDEELDARLMQIYVLYGWDGIQRLQLSLAKELNNIKPQSNVR